MAYISLEGVFCELEEIAWLIRRCLEKAPDERFQSARDLAFALDALSGISGTAATPLASARPLRKLRLALVSGIAALLVLALGLLAGMRLGAPVHPNFHQLVFGRGFIETARFTPDGQSVIYGAAWNNEPFQIFSTRLEGLESRSFGLPSGNILGIASNGQMALGLGWRHTFNWMTEGTLAEASLSGGAARPVLEKVCDGDISRDGRQFAVVRCAGPEQTLEFPVGKVLYRTNGYISHVPQALHNADGSRQGAEKDHDGDRTRTVGLYLGHRDQGRSGLQATNGGMKETERTKAKTFQIRKKQKQINQ